MKEIILTLTFGLLLVISSCSDNQSASENSRSAKNTYDIELVDNEKWNVNKEMMVHIKNMESIIEKAEKAEVAEVPDYDEVGMKLDENIELLTSSCTMTGKAHDELHKWLVPFIGLVAEMNEATDKKAHFPAIKESMNEFNAYFK